MLRHVLALIIFSILIILFRSEFAVFLHYIGYWHSWLGEKMLLLFSTSTTGELVSHVLALVLIPILIALIPAFLYWVIRRHEMPYLAIVTWILWIILSTIVVLR
jgi:hypothetical protein